MLIDETAARGFYPPLEPAERAKHRLDWAAAAGKPPSLMLFVLLLVLGPV